MIKENSKVEPSTEAGNIAKPLLGDVFCQDDEIEDDEQTPPDYYSCMCCGNIQNQSYSCKRCAGPMAEGWY